ncbi:MAG: sulfatase [Myxococcales bacterium]|nr:sulfatase [Myxococcales bacterium]
MSSSRSRPVLVLVALLAASCGDGASPAPSDDTAASTRPSADATPKAHRPNVVVYLIDTLRADRLSLYGQRRKTSPMLDELGGDAAVFEHAYSQGPWTLPSVVSLFTSSYPSSHEVLSGTETVDVSAQTMVEWFHDQGYVTAGFVSNTLGGKGSGLDQGYDHFVETPLVREVTEEQRESGVFGVRPVLEWLDGYDDDRPFFVYVHTVEPHWPYEGEIPDRGPFTNADPADWDAVNALVYDQRLLIQKANLGELDEAERARRDAQAEQLSRERDLLLALYDGDVRRADYNVRRVYTALRYEQRWDDTIFVVMSDHGEEFGDHGNWFHDQSVHDELVHVPLVVRVPGTTDGGSRIGAPVQLIDLLPTFAELLGAEPLPTWQGRSFAPLLRDPTLDAPRPVMSMRINVDRKLGGPNGERETSLVEDGFKAIVHLDVERTSLYDLVADPGEQHDLAAEQPERVAALRARMADILRRCPPLDIRHEGELDDEKRQNLEELGYLERQKK